MNTQEDFKRKYSGFTAFKNNGPGTAMLVTKQRKKTEVSREKEEKKHIIVERCSSKQASYLQDQNMKSNPKTINFRNLKETIPKKQTNTCKNKVYAVKPRTEYYQKNQKSVLPINDAHGISINVNIQNMLQPKGGDEDKHFPKNERVVPPENKDLRLKQPLISQLKKFDDFECTEQINFKRTNFEAKPKFQDKTIQKIPLIDKKHHRMDIQSKPKEKSMDVTQILRKFEIETEEINAAGEAESLANLDKRRETYIVPPNYIQMCQKNFSWTMRAILIEWMMHVSYEFSMNRQTFHLAVNIADLFMSKEHNLPKGDFQLSGAAAMFIASKLEEFEPKCSQEFAKTTGKYSAADVKKMEKRICKALRYKINPPTVYMWANRFMLQWDLYMENNIFAQTHPLFATCEQCFFKKLQPDSLRLFRTLVQLLDCATLQVYTLQYKPKLLVWAFMYLVLGEQLGQFNREEICRQFPGSSLYLMDKQNLFNDLFMNFLRGSFSIEIVDLLPTVQYAATFFVLDLTFEEPNQELNHQQKAQNISFQKYCSIQTYNPHIKSAVLRKRERQVR